jgi:hypothetical protein
LTALALPAVALLLPSSRSTPAPAPQAGRRPVLRVDGVEFLSGDLLFRRGRSLTSHAVLAADRETEYSHVGIVQVSRGRTWVIHTVPPDASGTQGGALMEPLDGYLSPDRASAAALYRPSGPLSGRAAAAARAAQELAQAHVAFDSDFNLADDRELYCTELVWRAYLTAGVELVRSETVRKYLLPSHLQRSSELRLIQEFREEIQDEEKTR